MRFSLHLSPPDGLVPFDYQHHLTGAFWKFLGEGIEHDQTSLYSLSFLTGGRPARGGLAFPNGATWTVSAPDPDLHRRLLGGVMRDPRLAFGMRIDEVREVPVPTFGLMQRFRVNGAVLARGKRDDGTQEHLLFGDDHADVALTRSLRWKLHLAGRDDLAETAEMRFDRTYERARTKLVAIKGMRYRCSECPVLVSGDPEAVGFAFLVGAGELTGSCLGALTL